ncbi:PadR family transcriptional regulator [Spirosoma flavum]|uniref:PadR family transcriptional regulator n=1 Tax=Spirosoma flavum TaxID=2048557 RepID=A0ABW6AL66_9BACT
MESSGNEFLRGTLKTIVLKLLAEPRPASDEFSSLGSARQGRMYGYEITQAVKERTHGEIVLSFGALYPVLHKLEQDGLLTTESEEVEGRLRKYYTLTPQGTQVAVQKISDFERFMDTMRGLLQLPLNVATSH